MEALKKKCLRFCVVHRVNLNEDFVKDNCFKAITYERTFYRSNLILGYYFI